LFSLHGVGKPRLSLLTTLFVINSRDILVPIGFHVIDFIEHFQSNGLSCAASSGFVTYPKGAVAPLAESLYLLEIIKPNGLIHDWK